MNISIAPNSEYVKRKRDWIEKARALYKMQQTRRAIVKEEERLKSEFTVLSEHTNSKGGGFLFTQIARKGSIDYNLITYLQTIDLEEYRKDTSYYWQLGKD